MPDLKWFEEYIAAWVGHFEAFGTPNMTALSAQQSLAHHLWANQPVWHEILEETARLDTEQKESNL